MAALNFADLAKPVSAEDPCGPDPDADPDFMNVMARLEVALPTSYFRRDDEGRQIPFDRAAIDFPVAFGDLGKILKQSRDIRAFVIAGKLCVLNRDIAGFAESLGLIVTYLRGYWEEIHPRPEDGDLIMREVALQGLDELATVVLPLQHAPLFVSRRLGPVIFRSQLVASGEIRPGEDEQHPDAGAIGAALKEVELSDLTAMLGHVTGIRDALTALREIWAERTGADHAVSLSRLPALASQIVAFLDAALARRAPGPPVAATEPGTATAASGGATAPAPAGGCTSVAQARAELAGCLAYFRRVEPSSPAVLLIGQAQRLIGKSLIEVIQIMFPEHVEKAMLEIGTDLKFQLPLERLGGNGGSGEDEDESDEQEDGEEDEGWSGDSEGPDTDEQAEDDPQEQEQEQEPREAPAAEAVAVGSRAEAIARMQAVAAFYRQAEPSNPVPLLMEKACLLAQQDFLSLLGDILPDVGIRQGSED
jgi:type VI secretion system protein ImpA